MIVTGAFFADYIEDVGSKFNVTGGVWDYIQVPSDLDALGARLVVLVQTSPDDYGHENMIAVDTFTPSGEKAGRTELKILDLGNRAENRYFHFNVSFKVPERGRYAFVIDANGEHPLSLGIEIKTEASS